MIPRRYESECVGWIDELTCEGEKIHTRNSLLDHSLSTFALFTEKIRVSRQDLIITTAPSVQGIILSTFLLLIEVKQTYLMRASFYTDSIHQSLPLAQLNLVNEILHFLPMAGSLFLLTFEQTFRDHRGKLGVLRRH